MALLHGVALIERPPIIENDGGRYSVLNVPTNDLREFPQESSAPSWLRVPARELALPRHAIRHVEHADTGSMQRKLPVARELLPVSLRSHEATDGQGS